MKKIDLDGALLWLGFGRGVCVVGSGDFAAVSWFSFRSGVLQQRQKNHETAELATTNTRTPPPKPSQSRAPSKSIFLICGFKSTLMLSLGSLHLR